jgi:hypothetical protein
VLEVERVETKSRSNAARRDYRSVSLSQKRDGAGHRHERTVPINPCAVPDVPQAEHGLVGVHGLEDAFATGAPAHGAERKRIAAFRTSQFHCDRFHWEVVFLAGHKYSTGKKNPTTFVLKTPLEAC